MKDNTTIFAPATAVSESSITVIRISGDDSVKVISELFYTNKDNLKTLTDLESHKAIHGYLINNGEVVDEVIMTFFKAPNSFTGEDTAEISIHGGYYVYHKVFNILLDKGLKFAEPGEFSKRSFLNGKMDLTQTEAIADLIRSRTELAHKAAMKQLTGEFSQEIKSLRQELINYCSLVELELDFSEEDIEVIDKKLLLDKLDIITKNIENMTRTYESGRLIKDGIKIAIVGQTNVGKSSVFNYLLKEDRAIVSEIPGTTRDYLQEKFTMGGFVYNIVDTAGLRETINLIEKEGIKRSYKKIAETDILIEVISLENANWEGHFEQSEHYIKLYNKLDLVKNYPKNELCVSALTGLNMEKLRKEILKISHNLVYKVDISQNIVTNERHRNLLNEAQNDLLKTKNLIKHNAGNEIISIEIRSALDKLTEIIGKTTNEDILNNIFSKFCIGK